MKQPRLLWFLSLLVCIGLACNLKTTPTDPSGYKLMITNVLVEPKKGSGTFAGTVDFTLHINPDTIQCVVTGSSGNGIVFTQSYPADGSVIHADFTFPVTEPGPHSLVCTTKNSKSSAQDDFTVTSDQSLKINGSVTVSGTNSWGNPYFVRATSVLLTVKSDSSAELYVVYTMNVDYTREEYMYFDGTADPANRNSYLYRL